MEPSPAAEHPTGGGNWDSQEGGSIQFRAIATLGAIRVRQRCGSHSTSLNIVPAWGFVTPGRCDHDVVLPPPAFAVVSLCSGYAGPPTTGLNILA